MDPGGVAEIPTMPEGCELQEEDRETPVSAWERADPQEGICVPPGRVCASRGAGVAAPKQVSYASTCPQPGTSCWEEAVSELLAGGKSQPSPPETLSRAGCQRCASSGRAEVLRRRQFLLARG